MLNPRFLRHTKGWAPLQLNETRYPNEERSDVHFMRGHRNTSSSQSENGRSVSVQFYQDRDPDAERQSKVHQCSCCSMLGDSIEHDQSRYGKCCKTYFYGSLVTFVYVLSVIFLLVTCPIVVCRVLLACLSPICNEYLLRLLQNFNFLGQIQVFNQVSVSGKSSSWNHVFCTTFRTD